MMDHRTFFQKYTKLHRSQIAIKGKEMSDMTKKQKISVENRKQIIFYRTDP